LENDENEEEPSKKAAKRSAKKALNDSFFNTLPKNVDVRDTSSPCNTNYQAPLATSMVINIDRSNIRIKKNS
jgi:hypothetical protein